MLDHPEAAICTLLAGALGGAFGLVFGAVAARALGMGSRRAAAYSGGLLGAAGGAALGAGYAKLAGYPLRPPGCCGRDGERVARFAGYLRVHRAPEPTDLIWKNLPYEVLQLVIHTEQIWTNLPLIGANSALSCTICSPSPNPDTKP